MVKELHVVQNSDKIYTLELKKKTKNILSKLYHIDILNTRKQTVYCISSVIKQFVFFRNNPKNLDPSYKVDLDLWDCLGSEKLIF